jgi:hypothetical protein
MQEAVKATQEKGHPAPPSKAAKHGSFRSKSDIP